MDFSMDEGLGASEVMDKAESEVFSLSQKSSSKSFTAVRDTLAESFDRLDELHKQGEGMRGVATGFTDLDDALAGMQKSNLIILAARPGVGSGGGQSPDTYQSGSEDRFPGRQRRNGKGQAAGDKARPPDRPDDDQTA